MERKDIPFTNEHFVAFITKMLELKSPYWYATCIFKCTTSRLNSKSRQCPSHYTSDRTARYKADIAAKRVSADCIGAYKGYCWTNGGEGVIEAYGTDKTFTNVSRSHGCPDQSANGMFSYAKNKGAEWGDIKTMPEIKGIALRFDGHVGYYIGGGYAIEWRGFAYGCIKTKVKDRKWTHWYKLPCIDYGGGSLVDNGSKSYTLGERTLNKGSKGNDVKELQTALERLGFSVGSAGIDGDFGTMTYSAVAGFQQVNNLPATGVFDKDSYCVMVALLPDLVVTPEIVGVVEDDGISVSEIDVPLVDDNADVPAEAVEAANKAVCPTIRINTASVNVRAGNGTEYASIGIAKNGATFEHVATANNGWHAIKYEGQIGWVTPRYSELK